MKKFYLFFAAVAMMFAVTSCSQEQVLDENSENITEATFNIALEGATDSRVISDGTTVDQLYFAVYDANGEELEKLRQDDAHGNAVKIENLSATVKVRLVKGQTYSFVFWAQKSETGHYNTDNMKAIKVNSYKVNANDETRDAFYAYYDMAGETVEKGFFSKDIVLKRPFAQLNLGTSEQDWRWATAAEVTIAKSAVKVQGAVYTTLDTFTGEVADPVDAEFVLNDIPKMDTEKLVLKKLEFENSDKTPFEEYFYLSSNYLLAPAEKELSQEIVFTLVDDNDKEINTLKVVNAPLQRNWRTNIVGDILTGEGTFNIIIDPTYDDERNYYMEDSELILPGEENSGVVTDDVNMSENKDDLGSIVDGSFQIKDKTFEGTVTIDESVSGTGATYEFLNVTFEETLKVSADVTIFFGGVHFNGNSTIAWSNGNTSNRQILFNVNNPCYVDGVEVTKDNAKTYFKNASNIAWYAW